VVTLLINIPDAPFISLLLTPGCSLFVRLPGVIAIIPFQGNME
jgi:hypothetical protein